MENMDAKGNDRKHYRGIEKQTDNPFLNLYHIDALGRDGTPFHYYFASRNDENNIKHKTHSMRPEGMAVYAVTEDGEKLVLVRQYRYPVNDYLYELPAGLIEPEETASEAACREMIEETGWKLEVYEGGEPAFRRGFFLAQGLTDESGSMIYTLTSLENSHWRVVGVSFVEELITESVQEVSRILAASGIGILLAAVIISFVLFRTLSRPMHGLTAAMRQFEQAADNFTYVPVGGAREVRALSDSFGQMVVQIQRLMEQVRAEEVNLRKTELRALQAQINPHFLYNTLDSIAWMCEQGRNAEAVEMVNALARLFRISISRGHELIPIRSELQHAESYLQIQSHRYKNQFSYSFDVQEECLDYLCNKITLQPIIENAIYHGINGLVDEGEIRISCRADGDDILFTVEDNGTGMEPEQVQAILRKERSDHTGIGIKNVNDRLKIYFGPAYGITIDSVPDEGTRVYIRMPKVREEAEYEKR